MPRDSSSEGEGVAPEVDVLEDETKAAGEDNAKLEEGANQTAESPDADDKDAKPQSTLEVVEAALAKDKTEQTSGSEDKGQDGDAEDPDPKVADAETKDTAEAKEGEGDEEPPFHKHPRWQEVQTELKDLRPRAEAMDGFTSFMRDANLTTEEVNQGMEIMRLLKGDPAKAYQALAPIVAGLQQHVGVILPDDLKTKVDEGFLTADDAKEMARLRSSNALRDQQTNDARVQAEQTHATNIKDAFEAWEKGWSTADPDYDLLKDRVAEKIKLQFLEGKIPGSGDAARQMAESAKADVKAELKRFRPKKKSIAAAPDGQSSVRTAPEPKSTLDVINRVLGTAAA